MADVNAGARKKVSGVNWRNAPNKIFSLLGGAVRTTAATFPGWSVIIVMMIEEAWFMCLWCVFYICSYCLKKQLNSL